MNGRVTDEAAQAFIEEFNRDNRTNYIYGNVDRAAVKRSLEAAAPHMRESEAKTFTTGHCEFNKLPGGCPHHNLQCGYPKCDQRPAVAPPKADAVDLEAFGRAVMEWRRYSEFASAAGLISSHQNYANTTEAARLLAIIDSSRSKP